MPALLATKHKARVKWLGHMLPRTEPAVSGVAVQRLDLTFDGVAGVPYGGKIRPSCSRVKTQHPEGTEISNVRQLSIVSAEEIAEIAAAIGLKAMDPTWMGATVVVEGIDDFTHIPPSSRLQSGSGTTLVVDMLNQPCHQPGLAIERVHGGRGKGFKAAAAGRRGVTAWVERPGPLAVGDVLTLHVPGQRAWSPKS